MRDKNWPANMMGDLQRAVHTCEVCGADTSKDMGRCTNGRCGKCHEKHCTPGGATSPGHGRGNVKIRK